MVVQAGRDATVTVEQHLHPLPVLVAGQGGRWSVGSAVPAAAGAGRRRARPPAWDVLAAQAGEFAQVIHDRWQGEEERRGVQDPVPLSVRWRSAPEALAGDPTDLSGGLADVVGFYRRITSGRLVVLGRAGSGKTVLMVRFVLDYLRARGGDDPVPVIFGLGSWNPDVETLRDWLIDRLRRDHPEFPALAAPVYGRVTLAAALVNTGRVLPVLDGFDEIAPALRVAALDAINRTEQPLLLTSRREEYAAAVAKRGVPRRAAAVELVDLTQAELRDYLGGDGRWSPVLDGLPGSRVGEALRTPLMVALARTVYLDPDRDPSRLLDPVLFPTPGAVEDHLLDGFVTAVYRHQPPRRSPGSRPRRRRDWDHDSARRWLGYLAAHVDQRDAHDLAWWQLGNSVRRPFRVLAVALVVAVANWLVITPVYLSSDVPGGFVTWLMAVRASG